MAQLHVVRVFVGPDGQGGNLLGIFLDGPAIPEERRLPVTVELGFSETVFVDDRARGGVRIFLPTTETPFAGHPLVGTAWLLRQVGIAVEVLHPPAGAVPVRFDGDLTWIEGRAAWMPGEIRFTQLESAAAVDAHPGQALGQPWLYVWAWEDETAGTLRSRSFPTDFGIIEDEASGAAAVAMGARLGRPLTIRQGLGSEIRVLPQGGDKVEVGGRTELVEERDFR